MKLLLLTLAILITLGVSLILATRTTQEPVKQPSYELMDNHPTFQCYSRVMLKSLWASVQDDPIFMRKLNGWATVFWIAMVPISVATGLLSSVQYVSALSLWALVSGHLSAWQAARVEVKQDEEKK